jgi:hypothetical protein
MPWVGLTYYHIHFSYNVKKTFKILSITSKKKNVSQTCTGHDKFHVKSGSMIRVSIVNNHLGDTFDPFDIMLNTKSEYWWKIDTLNFMHWVLDDLGKMTGHREEMQITNSCKIIQTPGD